MLRYRDNALRFLLLLMIMAAVGVAMAAAAVGRGKAVTTTCPSCLQREAEGAAMRLQLEKHRASVPSA